MANAFFHQFEDIGTLAAIVMPQLDTFEDVRKEIAFSDTEEPGAVGSSRGFVVSMHTFFLWHIAKQPLSTCRDSQNLLSLRCHFQQVLCKELFHLSKLSKFLALPTACNQIRKQRYHQNVYKMFF